MGSWFERLSAWRPSKWKLSVVIGFAVGVGLCAIFSAPQTDETDNPYSLLSNSIEQQSGAWSQFMAVPYPAGRVEETEPTSTSQADAGVELEPDVFLNETIARVSTTSEETDKATVELNRGEAIHFSINPDVQRHLDHLFESYAPVGGATVAMNPRTGEILALSGWNDGELAPNMALQTIGPAASIFKIVTASALLEDAQVSPQENVCYRGGRRGIRLSLLDPNPERDHRCDTLAEAMGKSANVVFARLADQRLTQRTLQEFANRFAFNEVIPFYWPVDISRADVPIDRLEKARTAAGFYHARLSALHGALLVSTVANGGKMPTPTIVRSIVAEDNQVVYEHTPKTLKKVISSKTARAITQMLQNTIDRGTATKYFRNLPARLRDVPVAGKTGSLSFNRESDGRRLHCSWFVGFAPADNPQVAVASVVLNDPSWTVKAPTLGRHVIQDFLEALPPQALAASAR